MKQKTTTETLNLSLSELKTFIWNALLKQIEIPHVAKEKFLNIESVRCGRNSTPFAAAQSMLENQGLLTQMIFNTKVEENISSQFRTLRHQILLSYIKKAKEKQDDNLSMYFSSLEEAIVHSRLVGATNKLREAEGELLLRLKDKKSLLFKIFEALRFGLLTAEEHREILTMWLLFPELIAYPQEVYDSIQHMHGGNKRTFIAKQVKNIKNQFANEERD